MDHVRFVGQADRQAIWLRSELHDPGRMRCHATHSADPQKDRRFQLRLLRPCGSRDRHGPGPCVSGQRLMRLARAATAGRGCDEEGRSRHGHLSARAVPSTASAPASVRLGKIAQPCVSGRYQAADNEGWLCCAAGYARTRDKENRKTSMAQGPPRRGQALFTGGADAEGNTLDVCTLSHPGHLACQDPPRSSAASMST